MKAIKIALNMAVFASILAIISFDISMGCMFYSASTKGKVDGWLDIVQFSLAIMSLDLYMLMAVLAVKDFVKKKVFRGLITDNQYGQLSGYAPMGYYNNYYSEKQKKAGDTDGNRTDNMGS